MMAVLTPKELSFLRRYSRWWHLLRISSVLAENFRRLSKMVPRYLYSSTTSTGFPWMVVVTEAARSLCLLEKVTTFALVQFKLELSHHSTNSCRAGRGAVRA